MTKNSEQELYGPPKVGADCLSYCGKCKMELAHVIVSMLDTTPAKCTCKTCGAQHKFRKPPGYKPPHKRTKKSGASRKTVKVAELWESRLNQNTKKPRLDYSPKDIYELGNIIQHAKFGLGYVEEMRSNTKMIVIFRDSERLLVHSIK